MHNQAFTILFSFHLITLVLGFAGLSIAGIASLFYFIKHQELKAKRFSSAIQNLPSLHVLDLWAVRALSISTLLLTFANITGIAVAHLKDPKGDWVTSPKFVLAIATWCWFLVLLFLRKRFGFRGVKFFSMVVLGFVILITTLLYAVWGKLPWNWLS